jgi:hypothetical protein
LNLQINKYKEEYTRINSSYESLLIDIENQILLNKKLKGIIAELELKIETHNRNFSSQEYSIRQNIDVLNKSIAKNIEVKSSKQFIDKSALETQELKYKLENIKRQSVLLEKVVNNFDKTLEGFETKSKSVIQIVNGNTINNYENITETFSPNLTNIIDAKTNTTLTTTTNNNNFVNQSSTSKDLSQSTSNYSTNNNFISNNNFNANTNYTANNYYSANKNYLSNNNYTANTNYSSSNYTSNNNYTPNYNYQKNYTFSANTLNNDFSQNASKNTILPLVNKYISTTTKTDFNANNSKNASSNNLINYDSTNSYTNNANVYINPTYSKMTNYNTSTSTNNNFQVKKTEENAASSGTVSIISTEIKK